MSKLAEAQQVVIDPNMGALLEHLGGMRREQLENVACVEATLLPEPSYTSISESITKVPPLFCSWIVPSAPVSHAA